MNPDCPIRGFCVRFTSIILGVAVLLLLCGILWCDPNSEARTLSSESARKQAVPTEKLKKNNRVKKRLKRDHKIHTQQRTIQKKLREIDEKLDRIRRLRHNE